VDKIKLGISTCLLGKNVRYDGNHAHDAFLTRTLSQFVEYVPVCPEHELGLGVPREAMRLVGDPESPRLVTIKTRKDLTVPMCSWAKKRVSELEGEALSGFIFKAKSPSSGLMRVKVYDANGVPKKQGIGLFARAFVERFPLLPVEEAERLNDPVLREHFIERIFVMNRWRRLVAQRRNLGKLVKFHTRHKLLIMAHSPEHYRQMGRLVATGKGVAVAELYDRYYELLMTALARRATVRRHVNVLQHVMGYFKKQLSADEKQELVEVISDYKCGDFPLIVPITLLKHYVRKYEESYLATQWYLNPHPTELRLRNHA
jgi:uncharacterized protein YbgA (DUF1722 family)/uncharacterized protein YbbK (DUF523 family)